MSRQEARRRLQAVDPNLKIVYGRRFAKPQEKPMQLPKLLSEEEASWWGLTPMIPDFPPEQILAIEAKWSKKNLQQMAMANKLDPGGDKELLVRKLLYVGTLSEEGELVTDREFEPVVAPSVSLYAKVDGHNPIKQFCCRYSDACAPAELLQEGRFMDRISWLREHYNEAHPGEWGKRGISTILQTEHLYLSKPAQFIESLEKMYRTDRDAFGRQVKTVRQAIKEREQGKIKLMPEFSLTDLRRILGSAEVLYG